MSTVLIRSVVVLRCTQWRMTKPFWSIISFHSPRARSVTTFFFVLHQHMGQLAAQNACTVNQNPHPDTPPLCVLRFAYFFKNEKKPFFLVRCTAYALDLIAGCIDGIQQLLFQRGIIGVRVGLVQRAQQCLFWPELRIYQSCRQCQCPAQWAGRGWPPPA